MSHCTIDAVLLARFLLQYIDGPMYRYTPTYLIVIYILTCSTMSVDVYSACVDFEFQNKALIAPCEEIGLSHENKA